MADRVIVMGLGNVLLTDDGAGVAALHLLARTCPVAGQVQLVDGGTLGLALLDYFEQDTVLILLDAVRTDDPPGTVVVLEGSDVAEAAGTKLSPHQVGVLDLLQAAAHTGRTPKRIVLVGVVPASLELGLERTPAVEAALPAMVDAAVAEITRAGVLIDPQSDAYVRVDVVGALGV
jgi:hydrogenase maturation protease